jgi:hypothetical protein
MPTAPSTCVVRVVSRRCVKGHELPAHKCAAQPKLREVFREVMVCVGILIYRSAEPEPSSIDVLFLLS